MTEGPKAERPVEAEKKKRLFHRIPTALLVTLLGIALTAWLFPALSRQWDDRQKAQQLKAAIVSEMASGTARALTGGETLGAGHRVAKASVLDAWSVDSLTLETRLRAYFGSKIVRAWEIYSWLVDRWDGDHSGQAQAALITATNAPIQLDPGMSDAIAAAFDFSDHTAGTRPFHGSPHRPNEQTAIVELRDYVKPYLRLRESGVSPKWRHYGPFGAEFALLHIQAEMAREISQAHIQGYSTNAGDLLHDLIP